MPAEQRLFPYTPSDLRGARVLVLAPHPDDETIGCGGCLVLHRRAGDAVRVVFVTSGELGGWGGAGPPAVAARREGEVTRALPLLGIDDWVFWRAPERKLVADAKVGARLAAEIAGFGPTLLYAPSPLDLHPDHRAVAETVRLAVGNAPSSLRVAFYETSFAGPVNTLVDVGAAWSSKEQALVAYQSQQDAPHDYLAVATGLAQFRALTLGRPTTVAEGLYVVPAGDLSKSPVWRWQALQEESVDARSRLTGVRLLAGRRRWLRSRRGASP